MAHRNFHLCGYAIRVLLVCAVLVLAGTPSCGGGGSSGGDDDDDDGDTITSTMGAMWTTNATLGALMVNNDGEMLSAITTSDGAGNVTGVTGFIYTDASGNKTVVSIDANNLPTETVLGDFTLRFLNWDTTAGTVDVALIFAPTGYVEIFRGLDYSANLSVNPSANLSVNAAGKAVCFPNCDTPNQNLSDLMNIGGTVIALGSCGIAASVSLGLGALPCLGLLVNAAQLATPEDSWINNNSAVGDVFTGLDIVGCAGLNPLDCASAGLAVSSRLLGIIDEDQADNAAVFTAADGWMADPNVGSGVAAQGTGLPSCPGAYVCTPGDYWPCYNGSKQCGSDCTWGSCVDNCGDGTCDPTAMEDNSACPSDCPLVCGDGLCNAIDGEIESCPTDCSVNACCQSSGNCPSETPYECPGSCCCCPWGQTCNSQSICSAN